MSTAPVWQGSDAQLLAELGALETRLHSMWAEMLLVVAEIDSRGVAGGLGYGTTVVLVRAIARVSRGEARARISAAADVLPGRGWNGAPVAPQAVAPQPLTLTEQGRDDDVPNTIAPHRPPADRLD